MTHPPPYVLSWERVRRIRQRKFNDGFRYPSRCICDENAPHVRLCPRYILPYRPR